MCKRSCSSQSPLFSFTNFMKRSRGKGKAVCMGAMCVLHMTAYSHQACSLMHAGRRDEDYPPVELVGHVHILQSPAPEEEGFQDVAHPIQHDASVAGVPSVARSKLSVLQGTHG